MATNSKKTSTTTTSTTRKKARAASLAPINLQIPPAPAQVSPTPPVGSDLTSPLPRGISLVSVLAGMVPAVSAELRASTTYAADFGTKIPPATLADALDAAAKWQQARAAAEQWRDYMVRADAGAWRPVVRALGALRKQYDSAMEIDPQIPSRYPQLAAMLSAKGSPSARAAKTRAEKAKKAAEQAASTSSSSATETAASAEGAATAPASAQAAAPAVAQAVAQK